MKFTRRITRTQTHAARRRRSGSSHLLTPVVVSLAALSLTLGGCTAASVLVGSRDDTLTYGTGAIPHVLDPI